MRTTKRGVKIGIGLAIVCFLGLTLSGIGGAESKFAGVNLVLAWYPSPEMDAIRKLAPQFEKEYGASVTLMEVPHANMYEKLMMESISGAGIIDLYAMAAWWVDVFAKAGYIESLEPYIAKFGDPDLDDIVPEVLDYYRVDGEIYALPLYPDVILSAYNKAMLDEAGVSVPDTWAGFRVASKKLQKDIDGDGEIDRWGAVLNFFKDESVTQNFMTFLYMVKGDFIRGQYGGDLPPMKDDPTRYLHPVLNNPQGVEALTLMVDMYREKTFAPSSINYSFFEAAEAFMTEKAAMYPTFADQAPMIVGPDSLMAADARFVPLPTYKGVRRCAGGGWGLGLSASSKNKEATYAFIKFFYGNIENAKKLARYGATPTRTSVLTDPELKKQFRHFSAMYTMLPLAKPLPKFPEFPEMNILAAGYLQEALLGNLTPREALDQVAERIEEIMKRAGYYE